MPTYIKAVELMFERRQNAQSNSSHCSLGGHIHLLLKFISQLTNKSKRKFVILQSIGIIAIKSSKTRAVIYTCRYSIGQFNP